MAKTSIAEIDEKVSLWENGARKVGMLAVLIGAIVQVLVILLVADSSRALAMCVAISGSLLGFGVANVYSTLEAVHLRYQLMASKLDDDKYRK